MVVLGSDFSLLLLLCVASALGEQEHKVHNIVLYPEKHSWCQTTQIQQVVSAPGFEPVTIQNNVCVGACFSYSIPKSEPAEPGELIGPYCDSCQPSEIRCYHVNLKADSNDAEQLKVLQKRVQVIMNCSCQSCGKIRVEDCAINDTNTMELPMHLYVDQETSRPSEDYIHPDLFDAQNSKKQHFENDVKLKNKLKKWFETYQNAESANTETESLEKYFDTEKKNEKIVKDLESSPKAFGMEPTPSHQKGMDVTHLVLGPHGSMVAAPTDVKLHIDSDSLKPNDEGLVVEYENHSRDASQKNEPLGSA